MWKHQATGSSKTKFANPLRASRSSPNGIAAILIMVSLFTLSISAGWAWEGDGSSTISVTRPTARITSVDYPSQIVPGSYAEITVRVRNDGGEANWQTISISFPQNPKDISIVSHDLNLAKIYWSGEEVWAGYGTKKVRLVYPSAEGSKGPWPGGETHYVKVKVKPESTGEFTFYVKSVAGRQPDGRAVSWDPASDRKDQQDEYVYVYTISVRVNTPTIGSFKVTLDSGTSTEVDVSVSNSNPVTIKVTAFAVTDWGGFRGSVTAVNLPLDIAASSVGYVRVRISANSDCPYGTYTIRFKLSGTP